MRIQSSGHQSVRSASTCEECQAWLPSYIDAKIGDLDVDILYPVVNQHLAHCPECRVLYLELLELAQAEEAGHLPAPRQFPRPDLGFLSE